MAYVSATGITTIVPIASRLTRYVRIYPGAAATACGMRVELFTPCAFAEYFGWQTPGATSGADWNLTVSADNLGTRNPAVAVEATAEGLSVELNSAASVAWFLGQPPNFMDYLKYTTFDSVHICIVFILFAICMQNTQKNGCIVDWLCTRRIMLLKLIRAHPLSSLFILSFKCLF